MDRFHAEVRELVGDVVIGAADLARLVFADQPRVGARQMEFLVADRLARAGEHGEPRKGHFGIAARRSEEHPSELQSLMRISEAVFCLKKKKSKHENVTSD